MWGVMGKSQFDLWPSLYPRTWGDTRTVKNFRHQFNKLKKLIKLKLNVVGKF